MRVAGKSAGAGRAASRSPAAGIDVAAVRRRLLAWYARAKRDLPWRGTRDPYLVWVSEVMLQQTQVERVREFFLRFTRRFPTVAALAAAREAEVLRLWEGLGYYRRARQLHAAARVVVADHGGEFPRTLPGLRGLPGVGRYTAGAIASIALDLRAPIVEANSRRVIARLTGHDRPLGGAGDEPIWEIAAALVPRASPGAFNQALMDLGAMVCTPDRPLCGTCPLGSLCVAALTGGADRIPVPTAARPPLRTRERAVVTRHGNRVLVEQRGPGQWWEGLWDFPRAPAAAKSAGVRRLGVVTYTVTHHKVTCSVLERRVRRATKPGPGQRWVTLGRLGSLAMTAPGRRIAALLGEPDSRRI